MSIYIMHVRKTVTRYCAAVIQAMMFPSSMHVSVVCLFLVEIVEHRQHNDINSTQTVANMT
jgi:hypothetical protein